MLSRLPARSTARLNSPGTFRRKPHRRFDSLGDALPDCKQTRSGIVYAAAACRSRRTCSDKIPAKSQAFGGMPLPVISLNLFDMMRIRRVASARSLLSWSVHLRSGMRVRGIHPAAVSDGGLSVNRVYRMDRHIKIENRK
jgi:hypothetical protein